MEVMFLGGGRVGVQKEKRREIKFRGVRKKKRREILDQPPHHTQPLMLLSLGHLEIEPPHLGIKSDVLMLL